MKASSTNRRNFLKTSTVAALAAGNLPYWFTGASVQAYNFQAPNERLNIGSIGTGDRWKQVIPNAMNYGNVLAVCDVDAEHRGEGAGIVQKTPGQKGGEVRMYEDYRTILDRKDIDIVTIVTPDHWHSKIAIEALRSGKDVYCEKPLTLTIDEGKQIIKAMEETKRVFQVGTQQRSEMSARSGDKTFPHQFLTAAAMVRLGRIGQVKKVTCDIGGAPTSGAIPKGDAPRHLNWDMWLGQAPLVHYRFKEGGGKWGHSRCHYEFRWWYEYSGGKMTDWGAHHVDIATWAIGMENSGPISVEGVAEHPVPFKDGHPTKDDEYNAAHKFDITVMYANGVEMHVVSNSTDGNGILFEGTEGRFFVSRGALKGKPVEELATNPLPEDAIANLYKGKKPSDHMRNFMECVKDRTQPISDVWTHHRSMTTCHLSNIAIRLGRKLNWDAEKQEIVGDPQAKLWQAREQRKGYEIIG
jgi:predicted dehydrogenase